MEANLETLSTLVAEQGKTLKEIRDAQLMNTATNASKEYVDTKVTSLEASFEVKLESAKRRTALQNWVTGSLSAVFGAVLALLVAFFISNIGKV